MTGAGGPPMTEVAVTSGRAGTHGDRPHHRDAFLSASVHCKDLRMRFRPLTWLAPLLLLMAPGCHRASAGADTGPGNREAAPMAAAAPADADLLAHGRYMVVVGGCNDCHTAGYGERGGQVPAEEWLAGSPVGFSGPWGTSYPTNLRLTVDALDGAQWLAYTANLHTRPPMPDYMLRTLREDDRRAIYRFIRSLGPAGRPAPEALPPGQAPAPPYFQLVLPPT
jgi:mono/diheme cytochrome c family protein